MGGGDRGVPAAAAAAQVLGLAADLNRVVPWKCLWPGCPEKFDDGATHTYIAQHVKNHRDARAKEQEKAAEREARRAKKIIAAGPSAQKNANRRKDMKAQQRAAVTKGNDGTSTSTGKGKDNAKGTGKGKGDKARGTGKGKTKAPGGRGGRR